MASGMALRMVVSVKNPSCQGVQKVKEQRLGTFIFLHERELRLSLDPSSSGHAISAVSFGGF